MCKVLLSASGFPVFKIAFMNIVVLMTMLRHRKYQYLFCPNKKTKTKKKQQKTRENNLPARILTHYRNQTRETIRESLLHGYIQIWPPSCPMSPGTSPTKIHNSITKRRSQIDLQNFAIIIVRALVGSVY